MLVQIEIEIIMNGNSNIVYKRTQTPSAPFEPIDNLSKKRPSHTKLDIEKMYEDSLRLAAQYQQLIGQNQQLKEQYQRVEAIKHNRQNLIATVQKIVEEKSKEINSKHSNNFSWLVFKLNNKIYDLKAKIEAKEKAISDVMMSRESDLIRQKHTEIECLREIIDFARKEGLVEHGHHRDSAELSQIKEIVWMQQEIKEKQTQIIQAEKEYQQEEKEVRRLMQALAKKKAQMKTIKEMELEHQRAQQLYKEEKKKKEQRIAGNKTYMEELQNQKAEEQKKLANLKLKFKVMQQEENKAVADLEAQLQQLRAEYKEKLKTRQETVIKFNQEKTPVNLKKRVKRVTHNQVKLIGGNLNYSLALRGVSHTQIPSYFPDDNKEEYSIREVTDILKKYPFCMEEESEALLLARYTIEDAGDGFFLEDMDTSQSATIIRSILTKLIGEVKVYERVKAQRMRQQIGPVLFKFGRLVQQTLQLEQSKNDREAGAAKNKLITKQRMVDALENTISSLQSETFMHEQVEFTIFYLFSWSKDLSKLELKRLYTMVEDGINWPQGN